MRLIRPVVRVLAENDHFDLIKFRKTEGVEHVFGRRVNDFSGLTLCVHKAECLLKIRLLLSHQLHRARSVPASFGNPAILSKPLFYTQMRDKPGNLYLVPHPSRVNAIRFLMRMRRLLRGSIVSLPCDMAIGAGSRRSAADVGVAVIVGNIVASSIAKSSVRLSSW